MDKWVKAASDKLHEAVAEYLTAIAAHNDDDRAGPGRLIR